MDSARWEQIQSLFHQAADLPEQEREAFLETACADDAELRSQLCAMLHADSRDTSLLDRGLNDIAYQMVSAPDGSSIQQEFGPYRLKRVLGEGGMGVVWLAERLDAGNLVAIKFLPHAGLSPARRERFTQEIKTLGKLKHPFIARLYDAGALADGTPWFVMEYVEGVRFTEYCRDHKLTVEERLRLFRSVCEAVQYAHGQEIIHRDLKPSNILVDEGGAPRLLDFGIAKELRALDAPGQGTQPGLRFLSPDYAPPEWVRDGNVSFYTDVYSLGVILYETLAGQLPFDRSQFPTATEHSVAAGPDAAPPSQHARTSPPSSSAGQLSKAAWSDLDVLCLKAMHNDAEQRYPSVEALLRDIDHYLQREPLEARPDSVRYRLGKFVSRNRRALAGASVAMILVVGLVAFYTIRLARERHRASREAAIATAMNRFLTDDLLAQSDPFKSGNAQQSLVDAISQASPRIDAQFKEEPLIAAGLHETIAKAFDRRSDLARARPEYERATDLFVKAEDPSSQDAIRVRLERADMEARSGDPGSVALAESMVNDAEAAITRNAPQGELAVRTLLIRGVIAVQNNDIHSANQHYAEALRLAEQIPSFDQTAFFKIKQRLAFTYLRLRDGAKAEALFRDLIAASSKNGGEDLNALPFHVNLSQTLLIERKYAEAIKEADFIYPVLAAKFGEDHDVTLKLLGARAAAEGSLHMWDDAIRDDQAAYEVIVRKQGPGALFAIETLSDTAVSQCRAGRYGEGEANARKAWVESTKGFGARAGITGGCSYALALCLIGRNKLEEASRLLNNIDVAAVTQLSGDSNVGASVALAQGEIAARHGDYALADRYAQKAAPVFDRSDADSIDKQALRDLKNAIDTHLRASR
jgi:serine/threonine protein kinase